MMLNHPQVAYRVIDSSELDDLVIWTNQNLSSKYIGGPALREDLQKLLGRAMTTNCFAGPLGHQVAFDPTEIPPPALPIVVHIVFGSGGTTKAFLYLNESTTELHIPERFLATGRVDEDAKRYALIRELAHGLKTLLELDWQLAEYGGTITTIKNYDDFWCNYKESVFERLEYEPIGE